MNLQAVMQRRTFVYLLCRQQRSSYHRWTRPNQQRQFVRLLSSDTSMSIQKPRNSSLLRLHGGSFASFNSDAVATANQNESDSVTGENDKGPASLSSPKLQSIYDRVIKLPHKEISALGSLVLQVLGKEVFPGEFGGGGVASAAATGEGGSAGAGAEEEAKEERTVFDLKLVGFDAKAKIKVIKEVRAIGGLGLKEAKELVESAPKVIQKDIKQDKADELKAQLEAVGAQIEIV